MAEKRKIAAMDVDGLIADFTGQFVKFYNQRHPDDIISKKDITSYNLFEGRKYKDCVWKVQGFYENLEFIEGAYEFAKAMIRDFYTIFVTAIEDDFQEARLQWFRKWFPEVSENDIYFATDKTTVDFDVLFDDCPDNILDVGEDKGVLFKAHLYNQHFSTKHEVMNYDEMYAWANANCERRS